MAATCNTEEWRNDPDIIWEDGAGDQIQKDGTKIYIHEDYTSAHIRGPATIQEQDDFLHRCAATFGRRITGLEPAGCEQR